MNHLNVYKRCIEEIRRYASENDVSREKTTEIFEACFRRLKEKYPQRRQSCAIRAVKIIFALSFSIIACLIALYNHPSFHSVFLRNLQTSIYPGLKILRNIAVPIVERYPSLAESYDEWCLVENPYFYVSEIDCWPCSIVHSVPDLTGHNITKSFNIGIPYTKVEDGRKVSVDVLSRTYRRHADVFQRDAKRVSSNDPTYRTIADVFDKRLDLHPSLFFDTHISWRINRMKPGRILRKLFPKPAETPDWFGQSTERFVLIDEPNAAAYALPNPECSNIAIRCSAGGRLIKMEPSLECKKNCRSSTILLSTGQILWYNWWYWRPISAPVSNATSVSVTYLTSYC